MNKSLEKNYFNSVVDELFLQHKYHIHKLIGFSHFKTNETLHVNEINYEINYDIKPQLDIIFYNSKFEKINYDNSINISFFKNYIKEYLLLNNRSLRKLDKNIPELNKINFNNYKITIEMVINNQLSESNVNKSYPISYNYNYESKYLKYKNKYLLLKNQVGGWACPCGQPVNNNLVRCPISRHNNFVEFNRRLNVAPLVLSPQFINKVQDTFNFGNLDLVRASENSTLTNIITLPQINLDWIPMFDEPEIRLLELFIIYIYILNYEHTNVNLNNREFIALALQKLVHNSGSNFNNFHQHIRPNIRPIFNRITSGLLYITDQQINILETLFQTPLARVIACKNNNTYFDGTPYDYINNFLTISNTMPNIATQDREDYDFNISIQNRITQPFNLTKFLNNTWRNEILLEHIFNLNEFHNSMGWETINLLLNFAEKLGSNFSNIKTIQFIHSYLHTLDKLNFDIPLDDRIDTQYSLNNLRSRLRGLTNTEINQLELALNINCSGYLLKNNVGEFYYPNNRQWYIKLSLTIKKRAVYDDPTPFLLDELFIMNQPTPTTRTSFCIGKIRPA